MKKLESNRSYLRDASVAQRADGTPLRAGLPTAAGAFAPEGEWLTAIRDFYLEECWGRDWDWVWDDPGYFVHAGQRFRLLRRGNPSEPSIWEIDVSGL